MAKKIYEPKDFTDSQMEKFADSIESYLHILSNIMILPEDLSKKEEKELMYSIEKAKKLVKKLKKHDRSVFRDEDDE
jgi:hypothetical protein|nr:MAG TPA: QLQ protein [Caudoviricetes sp.]